MGLEAHSSASELPPPASEQFHQEALSISSNREASLVTADDYARAERFLPWNKDRYVTNADIAHYWIGTEDRFSYLRANETGQKEFVVVDATTGERTSAFDHQALAAALSRALGKKVDSGDLPFTTFRYTQDKNAIEFLIADTLWRYSLEAGHELSARQFDLRSTESISPDGKYAAFVRDHNIWIRSTSGSEEFALTSDGIEHHGYAGSPDACGHLVRDIRAGKSNPPQVQWSPDSRYLLSHRIDERQVKDAYLIQSVPDDGSVRPKLYTFRFAMPGDPHVPLIEHVVFDIATRRQIRFAIPAQPCEYTSTPFENRMIWWSPDGRAIYFVHRDRFATFLSLNKVDPSTGAVRELVRESGDNVVAIEPVAVGNLICTLGNGDIVWYSGRSGWGHLYYYSSAGQLLHPITQGEWLVRGIVRVDELNERIFFTAAGREPGRDPCEQRLYRVQFDGSGLTLLTPEEAEHPFDRPLPYAASLDGNPLLLSTEKERFSASGRYFVDSYSRPDVPPVLVLRDCDGRLIRELERADISRLCAGGYRPVEPFQVLAADGRTPIYGNLFRPTHFDPAKKYPIIDAAYPAYHELRTKRRFTDVVFDQEEAQGIAELGFIVITIDGRGTPHRSQAFRNHALGRFDKVSDLEDHIAGIRQLAERYPYMDVSRVGIFGHSSGGFLSARAVLAHPDFYKVAVSSAGHHDCRATFQIFSEPYIGPLETADYTTSTTPLLAGNLQGKLLLATGDLDESSSPAMTLKLVDALIKANKDFDLLVLPSNEHRSVWNPYFMRRKWDYFVRNLLGAQPPANYAITPPPQG
jgi:dipeptidyl aminopeptidase/acylaminoacyl peptidase